MSAVILQFTPKQLQLVIEDSLERGAFGKFFEKEKNRDEFQKQLLDIVINGTDEAVKYSAIQYISNDLYLSEIVSSKKIPKKVRMFAIDYIQD